MRSTARLLGKSLVATTAFVVVAVAFLEAGSRYYQCPAEEQPAQTVLVCNSSYYPVSQSKGQIVQKIIASKLRGIEPSREELDEAINLVKYEDMPGLNGIVCGSYMIFVRDNLSDEGKYFVARHELDHVFRGQGIVQGCSKPEYCATMSAAKIYPVGFIETILSSLYMSASESPTIWCFLFGSWRIYRVYVLGW